MVAGRPRGPSTSGAQEYLSPLRPWHWVRNPRRKHANDDVIALRSADDLVAGFEDEGGERLFLSGLREWLAKDSLKVRPDSTRLIEFGYKGARTLSAGGR